MDNSNTYTPSLVKKDKDITNVMNLPVYLTSMLTYGHKTRFIDHFSLSFLKMGSNFIVTSLAKFLRDIEEPMVDIYGDFFITLKHRITHCMNLYYKVNLMKNVYSTSNTRYKILR